MEIEITLKNYRCFPETKPIRISLRDGFVAFVGVNNSGKSSILRFFYEFRSLLEQLTFNSGALIEALRGRRQTFGFPTTVLDQREVFSNTTDNSLEIDIRLPNSDGTSHKAKVPIATRLTITIPRSTNTWEVKLNGLPDNFPPDSLNFASPPGLLSISGGATIDMELVAEACKDLASSLYFGPFRNAVNVGSSDNYFDVQVGQGFISTWKQYRSGNSKEQNEACFKLTEDIRRIFGYNTLDITSSPDDRSLQVMIDGRSFKLHEVGSGLTQFILVLATAAMKRPSYILIDEPELSLHPSLQLDFLTTLASYATRGVLFTTHSIGLARAAADRVYVIKALSPGVSELSDLEGTPRLAEFLGELSFSTYKELGFKRVLLVEGRTEVKTFQQFLRLLKKDHEVVLIPIGGREMINAQSEAELTEITRISDCIAAVIDSERLNAGDQLRSDRQGFVTACKNAKIDCKVLDWRALENYLPDSAVKKVFGSKYQALTPFQDFKTLSRSWAKADNWTIAREMSLSDLLATDLGQFLKKFVHGA